MTKNEERINKLFKELVPETGKADSLAGELVRAMSRIGYRFYNDGDQLGIGYGKETCNPAGRFLGVKGNDKIAKLTADAWAVYSEDVPFPVSWTVKMKKKQKETQDILSYHTQAAGCSDKARAKASGGRQPIEECGRTGL